MTNSNIQPTHVFEDGAKLYRREGVISVEDKDGNMLPTEQVTEYARQFMNHALTKLHRRHGTGDAPTPEVKPLDWEGLKESVKGQVRHETLMATMPEVEPTRMLSGVTEGIYPVREITNARIESHSLTADGIVTTFSGEVDGVKVLHNVRELKRDAAQANDERLAFRPYDKHVIEMGQGKFPLDIYGSADGYKPFPILSKVREDGILTMGVDPSGLTPDDDGFYTVPQDATNIFNPDVILQPFSQALETPPPSQGKSLMTEKLMREAFPNGILPFGMELAPYQREMIKDIETHIQNKSDEVPVEQGKVSVDVETDSAKKLFEASSAETKVYKAGPLRGQVAHLVSDKSLRGSISDTHPVLVGDLQMSRKNEVLRELSKDVDPSKIMVIGAGAGEGYGLASLAANLKSQSVVVTEDTDFVKKLPEIRVGTIPGNTRRIGSGFGAQAARLAMAQAALGAMSGGVASGTDPALQDISVLVYNASKAGLQQRMRNLFEPDDRKEAKRIFANFKPGKFGAVEAAEIYVPKGVFFGVDGGTATGHAIIGWIGALVGRRDLQALGRLVGGQVGYDIPWSWNVFSALAGRLMWDLVQRVPATVEGIEKMPVSEHIKIMSAAIDQIVAAARSKK